MAVSLMKTEIQSSSGIEMEDEVVVLHLPVLEGRLLIDRASNASGDSGVALSKDQDSGIVAGLPVRCCEHKTAKPRAGEGWIWSLSGLRLKPGSGENKSAQHNGSHRRHAAASLLPLRSEPVMVPSFSNEAESTASHPGRKLPL